MDKIWLEHYPKQVSATIDTSRYVSLNQLFEERFALHPKAAALEFLGMGLDYQTLEKKATQCAAFLQQRFEFSKGDRCAIMLPNCPQGVIALLGILKAGGVVVNVNPTATPEELKFFLENSGTQHMIVLRNFLSTVEAATESLHLTSVIVTELGDTLPLWKRWVVNHVARKKQPFSKLISKRLPVIFGKISLKKLAATKKS